MGLYFFQSKYSLVTTASEYGISAFLFLLLNWYCSVSYSCLVWFSKFIFCSLFNSELTTVTLREASSTCSTPCSYCGAIFTAVCIREVVAPPINKGCCILRRFISWATCTISSNEGVIKPLNPIMSTFSFWAVSKILSAGTITPISIISYPLQPNTTPTIFFPISCTSPFTVANNTLGTLPAVAVGLFFFSSSIKGVSQATLFFITRALFTTCGKNIFPAPNRSPTTFIPAIRGPSITSRGLGYFKRASSVSVSM